MLAGVARRIDVDVEHGCATIGDHRLWLSRREVQVLDVLARSVGSVVTREELQEQVWGRRERRHHDRSVDVYIRHLRVKLAEAAPDLTFIHTHPQFGYRLEPVKREERRS